MNLQSPPAAPSQVAHELDATLDVDAFKTYDAAGVLLESGVARETRRKHAPGSAVRVVVGQKIFDEIEARNSELKAQFERHDQFDRDAIAAAVAKREWKAKCRVIRRETRTEIAVLTAMARYVGQVKLPATARAAGDDYDGRHAKYVEHFKKEKVA
jgi:hypothetical protein